jgi:hypothetical protein
MHKSAERKSRIIALPEKQPPTDPQWIVRVVWVVINYHHYMKTNRIAPFTHTQIVEIRWITK